MTVNRIEEFIDQCPDIGSNVSINGKATKEKKTRKLEPDILRLFNFHGVDVSPDPINDHIQTTCPFPDCGDEGLFFINVGDDPERQGCWDCKKCQRSGNPYTFLAQYHEYWVKHTSHRRHRLLGKERNLSPKTLRHFGFAWDNHQQCWLLPIFGQEGRLVNLKAYKYSQRKGKEVLMGTACCSNHFFNTADVKKHGPIYLVEGEWDAITFWEAMQDSEDKLWSVVASPGTGFPRKYGALFKGRKVVVITDKDEAGEKAKPIQVQRLFKHEAHAVHYIEWPDDLRLEDKSDLSDLVNMFDRQDWPTNGMKLLKECLYNGHRRDKGDKDATDTQDQKVLYRETFDEVIQDFKDTGLYIDEEYQESIAVTLAVILASQMQGDPVWLHLVGPPSRGKSLITTSTTKCKFVKYLSSVHKAGMVSGFKDETGDDKSFLPSVVGKCLIFKDYTEVLKQSSDKLKEADSFFRGAFDGQVAMAFGNVGERTYDDCHFGILAACTQEIHGVENTDLGERFLKYQMSELTEAQQEEFIAHAIKSAGRSHEDADRKKFRQESVRSFLERSFDTSTLPTIPERMVKKLVALAQVTASLRATVDKKQGALKYRPMIELGTRIATQLTKLAQCLCWVLGKAEIDRDIARIIDKIALDTGYGWRRDIIVAMVDALPNYLKQQELCAIIGTSQPTVSRNLGILCDLGICERIEAESAHYRLNPLFKKKWMDSKIDKTILC